MRLFGDEDTELVYKKLLELAIKGDTTAIKIYLDRVAPALKARNQLMAIPIQRDITDLVMTGEMAPDVAREYMAVKLLEVEYKKSQYVDRLEELLAEKEKKVAGNSENTNAASVADT